MGRNELILFRCTSHLEVRKIEKGKGKKEDKQQLIIMKMTGKAVVVPLVCVGVSDSVLHKQEAERNSQ